VRRRFAFVAPLAACLLLALLAAAAPASAAGPEWKLTVTPNADYFLPGHYGVYKIEAENVGNSATHSSELIILENVPPAGASVEEVAFFDPAIGGPDLAEPPYSVCPSNLVCRWPEGPLAGSLPALPKHKKFVMAVIVKVPSEGPGSSGALLDVARISGGGAPPGIVEASASNEAAASPPFGKLGFDSTLSDSSANPYTEAGGHPYQFVTEFSFATYSTAVPHSPGDISPLTWWRTGTQPVGDPKEIGSELPPGLIANPQAVPHCALADYFAQECALKDQVGVLGVRLFSYTESAIHYLDPVYNLQPTGAYPGELGATIGGLPLVLITAGVRSGSDYGVSAISTAGEAGLSRARLTLWGVPADSGHDALRVGECSSSDTAEFPLDFQSAEEFERSCEITRPPHPAGVAPTPFLTMPTECSGKRLPMIGNYITWEEPGQFAEAKAEFEAVSGCSNLSFEPTIEALPTSNRADSPSGLRFHLHVPQNEDPEGRATPSLKEAVVQLPAGLTVNPSSGNGLEGCSPAEVGLATPVGVTPAHFTEAPAHCPDASKIGIAEVKTPLLQTPLGGIPPAPGRVGNVYLATPHQNPSGSLLAGYIVLEGEGLIIKLAGMIETDPQTGQIIGKFLENPQTPFEDFNLEFFGGAKGDLRTPAVCGKYETTSTLTPFSAPESGPPAEPKATFETEAAAQEGESCATEAARRPYAPAFRAGTESPTAGAYSPFALKLIREDGSQELAKIDTTLPPGLVGKLAGVGECSDAALAVAATKTGKEEQANSSCPSNTEVGTVEVGAGAGPTPLYVTGHAYLAGPYKSAPLSLAIVTPAVAGPFDLGTVVVRTALYTDPFTAQIHAVSDEIPHILEGIPLDVRSVTLKMARPNFTLNPTNCEPLAFTGAATSVFGQSAPLAQRFQVGGCNALKFKPKLSISLKGGTRRHTFPALKAVVTYPKQGAYANIASAQVTLPASANLEQAHIDKTCLRPQLASHTCPAASIYGHARAVSPLLDKPLEGPVYLATGFGYRLPALVADLNGQIEVLLAGKVDTGREDGIRNTFEVVPDAPVSKFTLSMFGGKKGLIVNKENICGPRATTKALAKFTAQNGKAIEVEPTIHSSCKKKGRKHGKGQRPSHRVGTSHR
jgi:hypothetical protein